MQGKHSHLSPYRAHSLLSPQFDPIEDSVDAETSTNTLIKQQVIDEKAKHEAAGDCTGYMVDVRKAVRFASGGTNPTFCILLRQAQTRQL